MPISDKLINQLLAGNDSPEQILGEEGLLKQLTKRVAERAMAAEMDEHLGYSKHEVEGKSSCKSRNGKTSKSSFFCREVTLVSESIRIGGWALMI